MQHDLPWTVHLARKGNFFIILLGIRRKHFAYPLSEIFFSLSELPSSLRDLTFTSAELHDLKLSGPFSSVARLTLSMLHFFIADIGSIVS